MKLDVDLGSDISQRWYNAPLLVEERVGQYLKRLAESGSRLIKARTGEEFLTAADITPGMFMDLDQRRPYAIEDGVAQIQVRGYLEHDSYWYSAYWTGYDALRLRLEAAMADPMVKGIAWMINSNGGEVSGNFDLVDRIFDMRGEKPQIAIVNESAYSGGYSIASAADRIYLNRTGGVGSIGVIMAHFDYSKMLEENGVDVTLIYAGARKADGNRYQPLSDEARTQFQERVDNMYTLFVDTVARNRGMDPDDVRSTEAGMFSGDEAVSIGLADEVLSAGEALARFTRELEGSFTKGVAMSTTNKPDAGAENGDAVNLTDHNSAVAAALNDGVEQGASAERTRILGILQCEEAEGREATALTLAARPEMSVDAAKEILAELPKTAADAGNDLLGDAMDHSGGGAGVQAGGEGSDAPAKVVTIDTQAVYDRLNKPARA